MKTTLLVSALLLAGSVQAKVMSLDPQSLLDRAPATLETEKVKTDQKADIVVKNEGKGVVNVEVIQKTIVNVTEEITLIEGEVSEERFTTLQNQVTELQNQITILEQNNSHVDAEHAQKLEALRKEQDSLKVELVKLEGRQTKLEQETKTELQALAQAIEAVKTDCSEQIGKLAESLQITSDLANLNAEEIEKLKKVITELDLTRTDIDPELVDKIKAINEKIAALELKVQEIDEVKNLVNEQKTLVTKNTNEIKDITSKVDTNTASISKVNKDFEKLEKALADLQSRIAKNEEAIAENSDLLELLEKESKKASEERAQLREQNETTQCLVMASHKILTAQLEELLAGQQLFSYKLDLMMKMSMNDAFDLGSSANVDLGQSSIDLMMIQAMGLGNNVYGQSILSPQASGLAALFGGSGNTISFQGPVYLNSPYGNYGSDMFFPHGGQHSYNVPLGLDPANKLDQLDGLYQGGSTFNPKHFGSPQVIDSGFAYRFGV